MQQPKSGMMAAIAGADLVGGPGDVLCASSPRQFKNSLHRSRPPLQQVWQKGTFAECPGVGAPLMPWGG